MTTKTLKQHFIEEGDETGQFFRRYARYLFHLLANLDFEIIENVAHLIIEKSKEGKTVYIAGNGGSATTASHFAADLAHSAFVNHRPLVRAVSLSENVALLTALGNDRGYEEVFSYQLETHMTEGDILIVISASGNSPNIVRAVRTAKQIGAVSIGLVGFDGGELATLCDYVIAVYTVKGEYGPVEDLHLFLDHMLSSYIGLILSGKKKYRKKRRQ